MKMTIEAIVLTWILTTLGPATLAGCQRDDPEISRMEALEKVLREARIENIEKEKLGGRTGPWLVTLNEGGIKHRAVFRHVDRRRPQPTPDSYVYDIAAYELTKLLGIELIPPVVAREIEGRKGSLQVYLENCIREKDRKRKKLEPPDPQAFAKTLDGVKVLENLTYDECQDADDLYVHREDWRVCRVDFSEAFAPVPELVPGCGITVCSRKLYEALLNLDEEALGSKLSPYLSKEEIEVLLVRKDRIIEKIKALIGEKGEDAVLF
jgi:hypothetical protein